MLRPQHAVFIHPGSFLPPHGESADRSRLTLQLTRATASRRRSRRMLIRASASKRQRRTITCCSTPNEIVGTPHGTNNNEKQDLYLAVDQGQCLQAAQQVNVSRQAHQ